MGTSGRGCPLGPVLLLTGHVSLGKTFQLSQPQSAQLWAMTPDSQGFSAEFTFQVIRLNVPHFPGEETEALKSPVSTFS